MSKFNEVGKIVVTTGKIARSSKKELKVEDVLREFDSAISNAEFDGFLNDVLSNSISRGHKKFKVTIKIESK